LSEGTPGAPGATNPESPPGPRDQVGFADLGPPRPSAGADRSRGEVPPPPSVAAEVPEAARMGLLDHLEELRKVLIQSLLAAGVAAVLCWFWSEELLELVIRPVRDQGVYFTAPNDAFMARLKVAAVTAAFVVAPFVLFRAYGFVLPGLHRRERRVTTPVLVSTVLLFYIGVACAFVVVAPYVIAFMMGFGTDTLKPLIGVGSYLGFVFRLCLGFGLVFELPMVILGLCVAGVVRPQMLLRTWRYAIVIIAIVSAIFTPPDVISQTMMMVPVLVLYLGSALVALVIVRKRDRARALAEAAEED
jgi:sec-independent protein translocase protein TatC